MTYIPVILPNGSLNVYAVLDGRTATLEWLQQQVGGYIEVVPAAMSGLVMVVNEEGKLRGLPFNDTATDLHRGYAESIVGTAVVMKQDGPDLGPLDRDELTRIAAFCASSSISTRPIEKEEDE